MIKDIIKNLKPSSTLLINEESKRLEKEWGLNLEAFMGTTAQAQEPAKEESALVDVILTGYPADKKISVLKKVREFIDMGLLEAKNFVEAIPKPVKEDIDKEEAEKVKKALEEAGAVVELK